MNYKKSILSLVTIMALCGTASADTSATYLRLTSGSNDSSWTLFGVNGFSSGVASARGTSSSDFSANYVEVVEAIGETQDQMATCGLGSTGTEKLCVQVVDDTSITELKVATLNDQPFEAKEPVRSMYIKLLSNTPNVKIDYKASLEGQTLELLLNESTATLYAVTINEQNTYDNAAIAQESVPTGSEYADLTNIVDVLDYNFRDNPLDAAYYDKASNLNTVADMKLSNPGTAEAESATFYHFDSVTQEWKVWDKKFTGSANDFTQFAKGDAYWGRIDTNDSAPSSSTNDGSDGNVTASGLILGSSGVTIPDADTYKYSSGVSKLATGWNMLALDPSKPYIRRAATGLIATIPNLFGSIFITDSSGQHVKEIDINSTTATPASTAKSAVVINRAIERAKTLGEMPSSVNIKAFASAVDKITFISDAKFSLSDEETHNSISSVVTLTGKYPYNATGERTDAFNDLNESAASRTTGQNESIATSAYGEYAMIIDLMTNDLVNDGATGADLQKVAADLDSNASNGDDTSSAMIRLGTSDKDYAAINLISDAQATADVRPTFALASAEINQHALFDAGAGSSLEYGDVTGIDTNNNGTNDKVILASTVPFYIKDNTFTRAFVDDNSTNDGTRSFSVVGSVTETITPSNATAAAKQPRATAALISAKSGTTGVYADANLTSSGTQALTGNIIAVSTTLSTFDIKDTEDGTNDFFVNTTDSNALAKGAVAGVYALDTIAKLPLEVNTVKLSDFNVTVATGTADDYNISIRINGIQSMAREANVTNSRTGANAESNVTEYFNRIVNAANTLFQEQNLSAYAYHTYVDGLTEPIIANAEVVIRGLDINSSTYINVDAIQGYPSRDWNSTATNNDDANVSASVAKVNTLGLTWPGLVSDLKSNAIYTPDFASYGPLYTLNDAGYSVRSILKATTDFSDGSIGWDGIDLTRDESDWFANNEFNLFSSNLHSGYWVYLEPKSGTAPVINAATFTPTYTYYFDNIDAAGDYPTTNIINGGQFSVNITGFNGEISNAFVSIQGTSVQLKRSGTSDEYTADFTKYSIANFNEGGSGDVSFTVRATDGKGEDVSLSGAYTFDYTAPILVAPTALDTKTVSFSADSIASDVKTFYAFKEYIPELDASRSSTDTEVNRLIGSYSATAGTANAEVCSGVSFGEVNNIRVVGVDGTGVIGAANISDAMQFVYAGMLRGAHVLTHIAASSDDKAIIGLRYDSTCAAIDENLTVTDNSGVSVKSLVGTSMARLAYEEVSGVGSTLSGAWLSTYSIGGIDVIQVQNLEEYKGKPFFLEYNGKMYRSAFPKDEATAIDSAVTAIELDAAGTFSLLTTGDDVGERDTTGSEGEELPTGLLNNTLAP